MSAKANEDSNGTLSRKPGQDGRERNGIAEIQRARMLAAMAEAANDLGAANVTVAHVVARSGVSRRTFYEHFPGRNECFLTAFDQAVEQLSDRVVPEYERHERWRERIRAALLALLAALEEEPNLGCLVIVQALGAGQSVLARRQRLVGIVVEAVDRGRAEARGEGPPPLTAEGVVGAVFSVIHSRLTQDAHAPLLELANQLTSMIVLPYLGPAAARRELGRPVPASRRSQQAGLGSLRELEMRLTYRTVRVLLALGAHPGASNREVAEEAGIRDQGQVSKLLRRLQDLGLIEKAAARVKGEPNAWRLTERGASARAAISARSSLS